MRKALSQLSGARRLKPYPGKSDVRNFRGAAGNVVYGGTVNPPAIERAGSEKPLPKDARASSPPDHHFHREPCACTREGAREASTCRQPDYAAFVARGIESPGFFAGIVGIITAISGSPAGYYVLCLTSAHSGESALFVPGTAAMGSDGERRLNRKKLRLSDRKRGNPPRQASPGRKAEPWRDADNAYRSPALLTRPIPAVGNVGFTLSTT